MKNKLLISKYHFIKYISDENEVSGWLNLDKVEYIFIDKCIFKKSWTIKACSDDASNYELCGPFKTKAEAEKYLDDFLMERQSDFIDREDVVEKKTFEEIFPHFIDCNNVVEKKTFEEIFPPLKPLKKKKE